MFKAAVTGAQRVRILLFYKKQGMMNGLAGRGAPLAEADDRGGALWNAI